MPSDKPTRLRRAPPNAKAPDSLVSAGVAHDRPPVELGAGEVVSGTSHPGVTAATAIAPSYRDEAGQPKRESARVNEKVPFELHGK